MSSIDLHSRIFTESTLAVLITGNTTILGASCNLSDNDSTELVVIGAINSGSFELFLEESDDDTIWDDVSDDNILFNGEPSSPTNILPTLNATNTIARFGYAGKKRFIRVVVVATNSPSAVIGAMCVEYSFLHQPTPEQPIAP